MEPYFHEGTNVYGQPVVNVHIDRSLPERVLSMLRDILIIVVLVLGLYVGLTIAMRLGALADEVATNTVTYSSTEGWG